MKHHKKPEKSYNYDDRDELPKDEDFIDEKEGENYESRGGFFELETMNIKVSRDVKYDHSPFEGAVKESWIKNQIVEHAEIEEERELMVNEADLGDEDSTLIVYNISGKPPKGYAILKDIDGVKNQLWFYNDEFYPYLLVGNVDRVIKDITEEETV